MDALLDTSYIQHALKRHDSVEATRLVHEHYGTLMSYTYSRLPLQQLVSEKFMGEWKYLHLAVFELPQKLAIRALIELGLYIRVIDDDEAREITNHVRNIPAFGEVFSLDGSRQPLLIREVANKIIHAERYEWRFAPGVDPVVVCFASEDQSARFSWSMASINLVALGAFCGRLMS